MYCIHYCMTVVVKDMLRYLFYFLGQVEVPEV